jgi:hypothetical protein
MLVSTDVRGVALLPGTVIDLLNGCGDDEEDDNDSDLSIPSFPAPVPVPAACNAKLIRRACDSGVSSVENGELEYRTEDEEPDSRESLDCECDTAPAPAAAAAAAACCIAPLANLAVECIYGELFTLDAAMDAAMDIAVEVPMDVPVVVSELGAATGGGVLDLELESDDDDVGDDTLDLMSW